MKTHRVFAAFVVLAAMFTCAAWADADPSLHQIYEAEQSGQLSEAHRMLEQVLRDHPQSGKAHYVAAELYARSGDMERARAELGTARSLDPGLLFAKPEAVRALERELNIGFPAPRPFPWLAVLAAGALGVAIWVVLRTRSVPADIFLQTDRSTLTTPAAPAGPAAGQSVTPGAGSGLAGSIVSGLALGAGVVAGEDLAHRFLGDEPSANEPPLAAATPESGADNADLGGTDFGVTDSVSWNDDGGASSGDSDWT